MHGRNGIEKRNAVGRRLLKFWNEKKLCMASISFCKADKRKTPTLFCAAGWRAPARQSRLVKYTGDVKVTPWELRHRLMVVDLDKKHLSSLFWHA